MTFGRAIANTGNDSHHEHLVTNLCGR